MFGHIQGGVGEIREIVVREVEHGGVRGEGGEDGEAKHAAVDKHCVFRRCVKTSRKGDIWWEFITLQVTWSSWSRMEGDMARDQGYNQEREGVQVHGLPVRSRYSKVEERVSRVWRCRSSARLLLEMLRYFN